MPNSRPPSVALAQAPGRGHTGARKQALTQAPTQALCETYRAHAALGSEWIQGPGCVAIRNDAADQIYDVNVVMPGPHAEIDSTFAFLEEQFGGRAYRNVRTDPFTTPALAAELALRGHAPDPTLQLLLQGELRGPSPTTHSIQAVESDEDWETLARLFRADHIETDSKREISVFSESVTEQMIATHRSAAPEVQFFMAWLGGEAVAFFSSWPGRNGVGIVEDLFTLPTHRQRGIARSLIHHCVADARARGAESVLIGAEPGDTPKNLYAAMGFVPSCLTYGWLKLDQAVQSGGEYQMGDV